MTKQNSQKMFFFIVFMSMYTLLDSFNLSYRAMAQQFNILLPLANIALNITMAVLSTLMLTTTTAQFREPKGANMSFLSIVFGIFTYGCTSCVITFLATLGITFSVAVLPLAGLPYKLVSLGLIIIGYLWTQREVRKIVCEI